MSYLVDVAVPVPLRQTFTYRIPDTYSPDTIKAGHRVLVPFGSKLQHGITMTQAYLDQGGHKHQPRLLISYDAGQRVLAPEIARLLDWLVRYYRAPIGEAVKLVLPPGILSESELSFRLTSAGQEYVESNEEGRILGLLGGKTLKRKAWNQLAQASIPFAQIRAWENAGYLEVVHQGSEKESVPHATAYELTADGTQMVASSLSRAPAQRALLAWFQAQPPGPQGMDGIHAAMDGRNPPLRELVKKGLLVKLRLPKYQLDGPPEDFQATDIKKLTPEQLKVLAGLEQALDAKAFSSYLMFGVTGAGKTEVYLRAIQKCLEQGKQALFLVPEISLTPLMQRRIQARFGERLAILHSAVGSGERNEAWARVLAGKVDLVLGARSSIFAPLPNLGLLIVDEEHDLSYKQHEGVRYQARDLALVRAQQAQAVVVLGSATPSLESWHNAGLGRHKLLTLTKRATDAPLPKVSIVDMRREFQAQRSRVMLSKELEEAIEATLAEGRQVMILLNRRGYHSFLMCRKCGYTLVCHQCDVSLTYHRRENYLKCHYCDYTQPVPNECPSCAASDTVLQFFGEGTQQVEEWLAKRFEPAVVDRLDRDRLTRKEAHQEILARFERRESQILVGTQMIAKGHDFPNVTLVGMLNADQGLRFPDFRAAELVFQLLTQVAGRSGRGDAPGKVVIQTYMPDHYSIIAASQHDFAAFLKKETRYRESMFYPPFAYMLAVLITSRQDDKAANVAMWITEQLKRFKSKANLVVLGPAKAPVGKIKDKHRYQVILKSANRGSMQKVADAVVEEAIQRKYVLRNEVIFDVDPYHFF